MPTNRNASSRDRKLVAGGQKHEVAYAAGKAGTTPEQVKQAIKSEGNSRKKVEAKLGGKNK